MAREVDQVGGHGLLLGLGRLRPRYPSARGPARPTGTGGRRTRTAISQRLRSGPRHGWWAGPPGPDQGPASGEVRTARGGAVRPGTLPRAVGQDGAHDGATRSAHRVQGVGGAVRARRAGRLRRAGRGARPGLGHRLRPLPALAPRGRPRAELAGLDDGGAGPHRAGRGRHLGADADLPLQPRGGRADLRDDGLPGPGPGHARRRHRRGAQRGGRGVGRRGRVARVQGALRPAARGGAADARAVDRGPGHLRGRVLPHRGRHHLRPPRRAGSRLRRRRRPDGRQVRRSRRRRLHLHLGQGRASSTPTSSCRPSTRGSTRPVAGPTRSTG